jgi:hypothetical protein
MKAKSISNNLSDPDPVVVFDCNEEVTIGLIEGNSNKMLFFGNKEER